MKSKILPASMAVAFLSLGGCVSLPAGMQGYLPSGATTYTTEQVRTAETVHGGTVVSVRQTEIQSDAMQKGIGSGVGGAVGGNLVASKAYRQPALIVTVKLAGGETIASTQAADVELHTGERVQVFGRGNGGSPFRILPIVESAGGAR